MLSVRGEFQRPARGCRKSVFVGQRGARSHGIGTQLSKGGKERDQPGYCREPTTNFQLEKEAAWAGGKEQETA